MTWTLVTDQVPVVTWLLMHDWACLLYDMKGMDRFNVVWDVV